MTLSIPEIRMIERLLLSNKGPGIGNWRPGEVVLIIGDRPTEANKSQKPFIHPKGCAPWLAEQLELAHIPEEKLYWINAYSVDGEEADPSFIDKLNPKHIIALGKNASTWCNKNKINHSAIPHPQYWKRFRRNEEYPLLSILKNVA